MLENKQVRTGKTAKDRASGATARNAENKRIRAVWCETSNSVRTNRTFPAFTCNGKRNRSVIVINKRGKRVK
jgi:hypothetical protein